ncbi:ankyrin repeat-containing domain protein [Podospora appendiculata]|uniref:Ankyrin repeat-containing domain protein n=1 Tax=Podospora appendiculata TaxID=314037 RepID=A0AAE1CCR1_9PEZI|nr:ankyrin repeat-containing domain protein [Podospora appendiculata]
MSLQVNTTTKRAPSSAPKPKITLENIQHGIKQLYPPEDDKAIVSDVDIVLVPGLGAHPQDSWKSNKNDFNWTSDKDGLARDFPKARVLLYMYESAWTGPLKVKQFMSNIASTLLQGLNSKRDHCPRRPIVFIGHSMGGLVIAKAITIADARHDLYPVMFETIAGCLFFGTPFGGAAAAAAAHMFSQIGNFFDVTEPSKLLDLMKPDDEALRELKDDLVRLAGKLNPKIDLFCFYETHETDFTKLAGLPSFFRPMIPKKIAEFVTRGSATLTGVDQMGLAAIHRDLVKFDSFKDERYQLIRSPVKKIVHSAQLVVKNRLNATRGIDWVIIKDIVAVLDSAQVQKKRKLMAQAYAPSSWVPNEKDYVEWLAKNVDQSELVGEARDDCLWIRGPEGRGKTSATMAALQDIEAMINQEQESSSGQAPLLLAFFFCDRVADYSTAEDVLRSLVTQLINQQGSLAPYAKQFAAKKDEKNNKQPKVKLTVENLWQSLLDMLTDEFIGRRVYFVINNVHLLSEDVDSTSKFLGFIHAELQGMNSGTDRHVQLRWLFTSRDADNIGTALNVNGVRIIDLEDEKYGDQVQLELRKHAQTKIAILRNEKEYNKALAYFATSLIGRRAQNTQWIDITCLQLEELPKAETDLRVRRVLEEVPQELAALLDRAWKQIFDSNAEDIDEIKEMLRTLVLTYEDPTIEELGVLAGLCANDEEKEKLKQLVKKCKPLLTIGQTSKMENKVSFLNVAVKAHLLENGKKLLGLSKEATKWQHGVLALRSFSHLSERFDFPETVTVTAPANAVENSTPDKTMHAGEDSGESSDSENESDSASESDAGKSNALATEQIGGDQDSYDWAEDESDWSDDSSVEETDPEAELLKDKALAYTVKHWLHHASKATLEIAEDLSLDESFWKRESLIRRRWLCEHTRLTGTFSDFDRTNLTALHVAAAIGFTALVVALMRNGHQDERDLHDSMVNTPLHFAAYFGRPNIVEELLKKGAAVDDGAAEMAQTPLSMAASSGQVRVMEILMRWGADPNTTDEDEGPVVSLAITSGNRDAVKLLVEHGVTLSLPPSTAEDEERTYFTPLGTAASNSDYPMFEYLVDTYADKLQAEDYNEALSEAASSGRVEVFSRLLKVEYPQDILQKALEEAAEELNWEIVKLLLAHQPGLDCGASFYNAATRVDQQDAVLETIWQYTNGGISTEVLSSSLYTATDLEKESTVKLLLEKFHANPDATGLDYGNALTAAAYDGTLSIVQALLDAGADINSPNGWALQTAAAEGHKDVVEELLRRGADPNACTTNERFPPGTALQAACEAGKADIVELLLAHQADPNQRPRPDTCPIIAASARGEEGMLERLVQAKVDVNVLGVASNSPTQSTPLINAAAYMQLKSLQLLLDAGADINLADSDNDTALMAAARRGDGACVEFLLDNGADVMPVNNNHENALQMAMNSADPTCMKLLVDHVSDILAAIKQAVDSGNEAVSGVIRDVAKAHIRDKPHGKEKESRVVEEEGDGKAGEQEKEQEEHKEEPPQVQVHDEAVAAQDRDPNVAELQGTLKSMTLSSDLPREDEQASAGASRPKSGSSFSFKRFFRGRNKTLQSSESEDDENDRDEDGGDSGGEDDSNDGQSEDSD